MRLMVFQVGTSCDHQGMSCDCLFFVFCFTFS